MQKPRSGRVHHFKSMPKLNTSGTGLNSNTTIKLNFTLEHAHTGDNIYCDLSNMKNPFNLTNMLSLQGFNL